MIEPNTFSGATLERQRKNCRSKQNSFAEYSRLCRLRLDLITEALVCPLSNERQNDLISITARLAEMEQDINLKIGLKSGWLAPPDRF